MLTFITGVIARVVGEAMHHTFITTKDPPACVCVCVCNAARLLLRRSLSHSTLSVTNNVSRRITIFIKNENYCLSKTHAAAFVLLLPGALLSLSPPSVCIYSALDVFAKRILFATGSVVSAQENKCCLLLLNYYGHFGALSLLKLLFCCC
jgi:hypothetical protein